MKPKKPCKHCGSMEHWPYMCIKNPKKRKQLKKFGKYGKQWIVTRDTWIRKNPPVNGYWTCYLQIHPYCPINLTITTLTIDHIVARSTDPSKRYSLDNLMPACRWCNEQKGSRKLDVVT